eukprot:4874110-Pleurochrysis_carterae.AAC.1
MRVCVEIERVRVVTKGQIRYVSRTEGMGNARLHAILVLEYLFGSIRPSGCWWALHEDGRTFCAAAQKWRIFWYRAKEAAAQNAPLLLCCAAKEAGTSRSEVECRAVFVRHEVLATVRCRALLMTMSQIQSEFAQLAAVVLKRDMGARSVFAARD